MEQPKKMVSKIIETDNELIISTPNKKSWVLVFIFSVIILQFSNGIIQVLIHFGDNVLPMVFEITMVIICIPLYLALKGLLWQLKGINEIRISSNQLTFSKLSPLRKKIKTYNLSDIKAFEVKDESISEGPLAMLQLLGITDKIIINMTYGYETITTISGVDISEANELKDKLEKHIKTR